ncbi:MAG TPA: fibronectin type III domain-containing protein [Bradyrhizobium sp.]|nr:fibronectin type III domain-containing protein [Bradyrhizobium sp.]
MWRSLGCAGLLLLACGATHATVPAAPTNLVATAVSGSQINLSWTDNSTNETSFKIERKTGSGGTYSQIATVGTNVTTFSNTSLAAGTTYFYRVRASNSSGNSAYTNEASATPVADTTAPTAPIGLTATATSTSTINLSWTASTDNVGVTGYSVERCQGAACTNFALLQVVAPTPTTFDDLFLINSTSYSYRIRASDAAGNLSAYSAVVSATTQTAAAGATPPTVPAGLTATAVSASQIQLSWIASTDYADNPESGDGVAGYLVERCQGANCGSFAQVCGVCTTGMGINEFGLTTFSDSGLAALTSYSYRVRALDISGIPSRRSIVVSATTGPLETTPPTAPTGLTGAVGGPGQINLNWTASTDNVGVTAYRVEMCSGAGCGNFTLLKVVAPTPTSFSEAGLQPLTSYSFQVRATDAAGNFSGYSNVASVTTSSSSDTTAPSAPSLTATVVGPNQIDLTWTASTDDVGVNDYVVHRCEGAGCTSFAFARAPSPTFTSPTSVSDTGLDSAFSYSYRVAAHDAAFNISAWSNVVTVTTQNPDTTPPTAPTGLTLTAAGQGQVNLTWTASTDNVGVELYRVERCQGANCTVFAEVATPSGTSFSDYGLVAATSYNYRARAADAAGNLSGYSSIASVTTQGTSDTMAPTMPSGLTATAASSSQINLAWTASTDNVGVTGYQVDRCQGASCTTFVQVATPTGTSFNDTGLAPSTSYSYRVRATDASGNISANSSIVTATTQAPPDTTAPSAPTGLTATAASTTQINLTWIASTDNVGVTGYRAERCLGTGCTNFVEIAVTTATSFSDTGLAAATSYSYRVRAADAAGNLSAYSNVASARTGAATAQIYYIQVDHLNTARLIQDQARNTVWRWDQREPFGNDVPNGDPNNIGTTFDFPLRFPGQYFDRETNLAYNYFRDYDPAIGRYVRSDPLGIKAGLNTYAYVTSNPLVLVDPRGLKQLPEGNILDIFGKLAKPCEVATNIRELLNVIEQRSYENYQADIADLERQRQINEDACRRSLSSNPCFNFAQCLQATNRSFNDQLQARNASYDEYRRQLSDPDFLVRFLNAVASVCKPETVYGGSSRDY